MKEYGSIEGMNIDEMPIPQMWKLWGRIRMSKQKAPRSRGSSNRESFQLMKEYKSI
jgi:hypothetical protein